jgi:hypothetical protein
VQERVLSAEQVVFAALRPRCFYRPRDIVAAVPLGRSSVYRALDSLVAGQVVEALRYGRRTLYMTRQGGAF